MIPVQPWLRTVLSASRLLLLAAGLLLYTLPDQAGTYFAWTVKSRLTAATLASLYLTLAFFAYQDIRGSPRPRTPELLVFSTVTLAAILLHLGQIQLESPHPLTRAIAWAWPLSLVVQSLVMLALAAREFRMRPPEQAGRATAPEWFRLVLAVLGFAALWDGAALFFITREMSPLWPWPLTSLNARALAAGYLAMAWAGLRAAWAGDWSRIKAAMPVYLLFSMLGLLALLRYPAEVRWSSPAAQAYLIFLVGHLLAGIYGASEAGRLSLKLDPGAGSRHGRADLT